MDSLTRVPSLSSPPVRFVALSWLLGLGVMFGVFAGMVALLYWLTN